MQRKTVLNDTMDQRKNRVVAFSFELWNMNVNNSSEMVLIKLNSESSQEFTYNQLKIISSVPLQQFSTSEFPSPVFALIVMI